MLTGLPPELELAVALDRCFDASYGLEIVADEVAEGGGLRSIVAVADCSLGPTGIIHGGVYSSVAEALAARATLQAVVPLGQTAVGLGNDTRFLRPISAGHVHSQAIPRHRSTDLWLWDVEHRDDQQRLCALTRMTIAVR